MIESKITSKGQITIPKIIREYLNVDVSDTVEFTLMEDGKVLISSKQESAAALFGMLKHRKGRNSVSVSEMEKAISRQRKQRHAK